MYTTTPTYPGRKDSMTQYVADNAPRMAPLAPFDFFHSSPSTGVVLERLAAVVPMHKTEPQWTPAVAARFSDFN